MGYNQVKYLDRLLKWHTYITYYVLKYLNTCISFCFSDFHVYNSNGQEKFDCKLLY